MSARDDLARQALALTPVDRLYLADILEQSLAEEAGSAQVDVDAAWSAEIDRRIADYDRGEVQGLDFETSVSLIRQQLLARRNRKVTS